MSKITPAEICRMMYRSDFGKWLDEMLPTDAEAKDEAEAVHDVLVKLAKTICKLKKECRNYEKEISALFVEMFGDAVEKRKRLFQRDWKKMSIDDFIATATLKIDGFADIETDFIARYKPLKTTYDLLAKECTIIESLISAIVSRLYGLTEEEAVYVAEQAALKTHIINPKGSEDECE